MNELDDKTKMILKITFWAFLSNYFVEVRFNIYWLQENLEMTVTIGNRCLHHLEYILMWVTEKEQNHCQRSRFSSSIPFCWQGNNGQSLDGANQTLISNQDKEEHNNLQRRLKREDLFNFSYDYWSCFVWNSFQNSSDTCSNWLACVVDKLFLFMMFHDFFS